MGELYFVAEDPTITIPRYASRISTKSWERHRPIIQSLYEKGLTRREILTELSNHHFTPSFGQLVAQMTKWRLVRYSKPTSIPPSPPTSRCPPPAGIMGVSSVLLAVEPATPLIPQDDSTWAGTSYELTQLISDLRITSTNYNSSPSSSSDPDDFLPDATTSYSLQRRRELLDTADLLFLGGSYAHAYHTYRDVYRLPLHAEASLEESLDEEQLQVQGIIGCLKSSATDVQREESIYTAQRFVDGLEEWCEGSLMLPPSETDLFTTLMPMQPSSSSPPPTSIGIRTAFETWQSSDCAVSKAIFDLLTRYKRSRAAGIIPSEVTWAHRVTMQEWMCMRLVRVPSWHDAVAFRLSSSLSASTSFSTNLTDELAPQSTNLIFEPDDLSTIFQWTIHALRECGAWYDEQMSILRAVSASSLSSTEVLLFWRLAFFSKHSSDPCPELRVRLSADVVYVATSLQTTSAIACVLLNSLSNNGAGINIGSLCVDDPAASAGSATHLHTLDRMQAALAMGDDFSEPVLEVFWTALKAKLAPSFNQRCQV